MSQADRPAEATEHEDITAAAVGENQQPAAAASGAGEGDDVERTADSEAPRGAGEAEEPDPDTGPGEAERVKQLEGEGDIAADYLEELLDIADLGGDLDMDVEGDRAAVSIVGDGLDPLVGDGGAVLEALQELTRLAVYRETGERSRLMLDIGGYRAELRKKLVAMAREAVEDVTGSGDAVKLAPMTPFERKVVHDAVAVAGLSSESEGVEPTRCVVVRPAS
ncbi:MAG: single-stranded DNA-binding protein [Nocardioidaceae bacterium]|nr:single-stranded DNA-binding protein [Nocardioidaceae bacterium]